MDRIVYCKKLSKRKHKKMQNDKKNKPKNKSRSVFENQIKKIGMNRVLNLDKITNGHKGKPKADTGRISSNQGMFANSLCSKVVKKNDFKFEEFKNRLNCDLNKIYKNNKEPEPSSSMLIKDREIEMPNSPVYTNQAKENSPQHSKIKKADSEMVICQKIGDEKYRHDKKIDNIIKNALSVEDPICTSHSYILNKVLNIPNKNKGVKDSLGNRFQSYINSLESTISKECSKLNINLVDDTVKTLKNIYAKFKTQGPETSFNIETNRYIEKDYLSIFDEDAAKKNFDQNDTFLVLQPESYRTNDIFNIFTENEENQKRSDHNLLDLRQNNFDDSYDFDNMYSKKIKSYNPLEEIFSQSKNERPKINFETPEYHYQKMNL